MQALSTTAGGVLRAGSAWKALAKIGPEPIVDRSCCLRCEPTGVHSARQYAPEVVQIILSYADFVRGTVWYQ